MLAWETLPISHFLLSPRGPHTGISQRAASMYIDRIVGTRFAMQLTGGTTAWAGTSHQ